MSVFDKIGGRKTVMTVLLVGLGTTVDLVAVNGMSQNLLTLLMVAGSGFLVGNVLEHGAAAMKKRVSGVETRGRPAKVDVDLAPIMNKLDSMNSDEAFQQALAALEGIKASQETAGKRDIAHNQLLMQIVEVLDAATKAES